MSDRPLGRALVRLGAMALGRARAHRQDLWPGMAVDPEAGQVRWRGRPLTRLTPLARIVPAGLPLIAIVGTGPSLRGQRLDRIPPRSAILLNGAAQLARTLDPLAVMVEDERFVFRHAAMLAAVPPAVPLILSPAALRALAERGADVLTGRPVGLLDNLAKPVNRPRRSLEAPAVDRVLVRGDGAALSRDPGVGVVIVGTVAFSAMQLALAARPARILLAGIDLGNAAEPRFYEAAGQAAPSGLAAGLPRILSGFALALQHAEGRGITVGVASPVSALLGIGYPSDDSLRAPDPPGAPGSG